MIRMLDMPVAASRGEIVQLQEALDAAYIPAYTIEPDTVSEIIGQDAVGLAEELLGACRDSTERGLVMAPYDPILDLVYGLPKRPINVSSGSLMKTAGSHFDPRNKGVAVHFQCRILSGSSRSTTMSLLHRPVDDLKSTTFVSLEEMNAEHAFRTTLKQGSITPFAAGEILREDGEILQSLHDFEGYGEFVRVSLVESEQAKE